MAPTAFVPDFEDYDFQDKHSDVIIVVEDDSGDVASPRLPGHSMVLVAFSSYCKAKLDGWSPAAHCTSCSAPCKQEVKLTVPAGQQELAELLVKGMYQAVPTITDGLSQAQLLQLMLLADRFGCPKVVAVAAAALGAVEVHILEWSTVLQLLCLPRSCAQQPEFKSLQETAVKRLQQQLGDLEQVWAEDELQQQLLALPYEVLLQLLQDDSTRVATENTVVYTIKRWCAQFQDITPEQLQQLMSLVRMRHCTPYYAGTIMSQSSIVQAGFERSALPLMRECCSSGGLELLSGSRCAVLQKYPAWSAEQRPSSAKQPVLEWRLPLDKVKTAVERRQLFQNGTSFIGGSDTYVVQGQPMQIAAIIQADGPVDAETGKPPLHLGVYVRLLDMPLGSMRLVRTTISMQPARLNVTAAVAAAAPYSKDSGLRPISSELNHWGFADLVSLGSRRSWSGAMLKNKLCMLQLVHGRSSAAGAQDVAHGLYLLVKVRVNELL